jgi:hypothetical protein
MVARLVPAVSCVGVVVAEQQVAEGVQVARPPFAAPLGGARQADFQSFGRSEIEAHAEQQSIGNKAVALELAHEGGELPGPKPFEQRDSERGGPVALQHQRRHRGIAGQIRLHQPGPHQR